MSTMHKAFSAMERGADLVHAFLGYLEGRAPTMDPAHAERLSAIEEMARLIADAASGSPRSLRPDLLAEARILVARLAVDVEDPAADLGVFEDDATMRPMEVRVGTVAAALLGLSMAIDAIEAPLRRGRQPYAEQVVAPITLRRVDVRSWASKVVSAVSGLEGSVLLDPAPAPAGLRRDAWSTAIALSSGLAHATEYGLVDARIVMRRLAEAASTITQAVAVISSDAAARGSTMEMRHVEACLAIMPVVEEGMRLVKAALADNYSCSYAMTWHVMVRGRSWVSDAEIDAMASRLSAGGCDVVLLDSLRKGARAVARDWAEADLEIAS